MDILRYGSRGILVELLQSTLKKLGFYNGTVDGIFGANTRDAVYTFQREFGIDIDGVVGPITWKKLMPYINGTVGNIVPTNMSYSYRIMIMNINDLKRKYDFLSVGSLGSSVLGKELPYIRLGIGPSQVFYSGSIHANEWINSVVLMKFIEDYAIQYEQNGSLYGKNIRELYNEKSIYIAPMINPDGVDLVVDDMSKMSNAYKNARLIASNYPMISFPSGCKANILVFYLNLQFPAN